MRPVLTLEHDSVLGSASPGRVGRVPRAAAAIALVLGGAALAGWALDVTALKSILPGLPTMKANTAALFVLCAVALWLQLAPAAQPRRAAAARACALVVAAAAAATLAEHVLGVDLGIDALLLPSPAGARHASSPGRMAPNSALGLAALGSALIVLDVRCRALRAWASPLAIVALLIAYVASIGYLLGAEALYGVSGYASMALHTAVGMCVLSVGVLAARPERGAIAILLQHGSAGAAVRRILPLIVAVPLALAWVRLRGQQAGLYGTEFGLALMVATSTTILAALALWNARVQGASEAARQQASAALRRSEQDLAVTRDAEHTAQLALLASERKYRDLFEHSPDMYITIDVASGLILDCNQTLCDRLGYAAHELVGRPGLILYPPEDGSDARTADAARFQDTGELADVERRLCCKDGRRISVSLNSRAIRDADGRISAARVTWRDISARKQADRDLQLLVRLGEALQSSTDEDELLHAACVEIARHLDVPRCWFLEIDAADDERAAIRRDVHAEYPSLAGIYPLAAFAPEIVEPARRGEPTLIGDALGDPRTAGSQELARRPASVRAWLSVPLRRRGAWVASLTAATAEPRRWEDREVHLLGLVAERVWSWIEHLRLLTELRERSVQAAIQAAIEKTEARFRLLVDAIQDYAVYMLDADGRVATWNAGAQRIKGYTADQILGRPFDVFYTPEDIARGHPREVLARARAGGNVEDEGWRVRSDGSRFWASTAITAMRDAGGRIEGFAKVTRDITEPRRQQEALQAREQQLTQHVRERDVLLQEIHHRVKNNLQVISSLMNMQVRKLGASGERSALEECQTRVEAIALIHEQLYQSRDFANVPFSEYTRSLVGNVFRTMGTAPGSVELALAIDEVAVPVDKAIPCGLLLNELVTNALKHAFPGGRRGQLRVELGRRGNEIRLVVADDGIGLPSELDVPGLRSLGLRLVNTLVRQLRGTLAVDGSAGARFELAFHVDG